MDINNPNFTDGVKLYPKKDNNGTLTQEAKTFGRTGGTYSASFLLTSGGGSTPFAQWKAIFERWNANADEVIELSVDFGATNIETVQGVIDSLTKTVRATEGQIKWIISMKIDITSLSLS